MRSTRLVGGREVELLKIEIAGDPARIDEWLGGREQRDLVRRRHWLVRTAGQARTRCGDLLSTPRGEVRI